MSRITKTQHCRDTTLNESPLLFPLNQRVQKFAKYTILASIINSSYRIAQINKKTISSGNYSNWTVPKRTNAGRQPVNSIHNTWNILSFIKHSKESARIDQPHYKKK